MVCTIFLQKFLSVTRGQIAFSYISDAVPIYIFPLSGPGFISSTLVKRDLHYFVTICFTIHGASLHLPLFYRMALLKHQLFLLRKAKWPRALDDEAPAGLRKAVLWIHQ